MEQARITLFTRPGCHLCEFARAAVARVHASTGAGWVEIDVESDPELEREYGGRVPVVLLDGAEHDYFRVDEQRLEQALRRERRA
jgi:glutaredoxin